MWYNKSSNAGAVAQLVEQRPEEPCVTGSSPVGATKCFAFGVAGASQTAPPQLTTWVGSSAG